jgi:asparagine N-glycosylation enzyme membrane subunit Stt3
VFGLQPVAWHLLAVLLRWAGVLLFYLSLKELWPRMEGPLRWLGALLLVYPGFFQQSTSAAYSRHFTSLFLFMLSVYLMVLAVKRPRRAWWLLTLSWLAGLLQIFTMEYFAGLELLRPMFLWLLVNREGSVRRRDAIRKTVLWWLPFVALFGIYAWWRLVIFPAGISTPGTSSSWQISSHRSLAAHSPC